MRKIYGRSILFILIFTLLSLTRAQAWDKELYHEWEQTYLQSTDFTASARLIETNKSWMNRWLNKAMIPVHCESVYEIQKVMEQPLEMNVLPGDHLMLKFRCDGEGNYRGAVRSFPWIEKEGELFRLSLRSSYLKKKGRQNWQLNNHDKVFKPLP